MYKNLNGVIVINSLSFKYKTINHKTCFHLKAKGSDTCTSLYSDSSCG